MPTWSALPCMSRMRERIAPLCVLHAAARLIIVRTGMPVIRVKKEQVLRHSKACRAFAANVAGACQCLHLVDRVSRVGCRDHGHWHGRVTDTNGSRPLASPADDHCRAP
jgi:hypothetical protein